MHKSRGSGIQGECNEKVEQYPISILHTEFTRVKTNFIRKEKRTMQFRKLTANDVEARVQSCDDKGFVLLLYKNARCDMNILDETVGAENWQREHYECKGNLFCRVGICCTVKIDMSGNEGDILSPSWVWKADCGTESNTEKEKGESSDSFKRACFNWGIGRELYTAPKTKIKGHTTKTNRNGKDVYVPEYYAFDVVKMDVSDDKPRKITALTIVGKSMQGGYHEDVIFDWADKQTPSKVETKAEPKATDKQISLIEDLYTDEEIEKIYKRANVESLKGLTVSQASNLISKRKGK